MLKRVLLRTAWAALAVLVSGCTGTPKQTPSRPAAHARQQPDIVVTPRAPTREEVTRDSILYRLGAPQTDNPLPW